MAILCAVGLIAGGGLFMHHEWKDKKDQPVIQRNHDHGKAAGPSQGSLQEELRNSPAFTIPIEEGKGEDRSPATQ
jgi:hypothetical protein